MDFLLETSFLEETNLIVKLFTLKLRTMNEMTEILVRPAAEKNKECCEGNHRERLLGMRDAIEVLSGKWKLQLIGTLLFGGKMRFMDLLREVEGIAAKMLSKALQDLEAHQLITRTVKETKPITVEYEITPYGRSLEHLIIEISRWGLQHRRKIMRP